MLPPAVVGAASGRPGCCKESGGATAGVEEAAKGGASAGVEDVAKGWWAGSWWTVVLLVRGGGTARGGRRSCNFIFSGDGVFSGEGLLRRGRRLEITAERRATVLKARGRGHGREGIFCCFLFSVKEKYYRRYLLTK